MGKFYALTRLSKEAGRALNIAPLDKVGKNSTDLVCTSTNYISIFMLQLRDNLLCYSSGFISLFWLV